MKTLSLKTRINAAILILGASFLCAQAASAYTVYKLKENYYAIVCADGQIFSYSGGVGGIGIVGGALCEGHGGIAGGSGGGLTLRKASSGVAVAVQSCQGAGGRKIDNKTTQCKARYTAKNRNTMRTTSSGPAKLSSPAKATH
ncbi:MAG: hypothetical protein ACI9Y1_002222 [Lentisphaeria bacterium]|jgi:hypothetical protein